MAQEAYKPIQKQHPAGVPLNSYTKDLYPVAEQFNGKPEASVPVYDRLRPHEVYIRNRFCFQDEGLTFERAFDYQRYKGGLPVRCFSEFTFDEFAKVWYSRAAMPIHYQDLFQPASLSFDREPEIHHWLVGKLDNSLFRWGCSASDWNCLVAFFQALRRFDFGLPDFTVNLDHTTWFNELGYSYHTRTYLDGVFGYLIHYRGRHVMTIGFSASRDRRLLINQVQLKARKGNRWLYKLPTGHLDYALARMAKAFPLEEGFSLYLADGVQLANRIEQSYRLGNGPRPNRKALARVATFYAQPLSQFVRRGYSTINRQRFHRLIARQDTASKRVLLAA